MKPSRSVDGKEVDLLRPPRRVAGPGQAFSFQEGVDEGGFSHIGPAGKSNFRKEGRRIMDGLTCGKDKFCGQHFQRNSSENRVADVSTSRRLWQSRQKSPALVLTALIEGVSEQIVSRILFRFPVTRRAAMIIPLGRPLPAASSDTTREHRGGQPRSPI